ncbi:chloride channel, nucleotide-sensitive, 1A, putative [Eimeria mitis]|uniref:Chloride channel, nucleotide-sensitive, 1A, putative n=1 Tax=Eimeria mitis TaxID=44415 RepID=U6K381_9EIME|nr:chloride channel, nucleotide-sensitive, 1A, putative [Eimeria mitis]CDJ30787.1 chloride channel, nucleotide-sensitive, 1A, putative [Eimeria mitis]
MARAPHRTASGDLELQDNEAIGFRVPRASIVIGGKDAEACDRPCLYCQIKGEALPDLSNGNPVGFSTSDSVEAPEEAEEIADDDLMVELKFIPDDSSCLQRLFTVMSDMAALHPDPDSGALDGDEDELFDEAALRRQGWEFVENDGNDAGGNGDMDA